MNGLLRPRHLLTGCMFRDFLSKDAGFDMGDFAITETVGWGGFVLGGAPGF